MECSQNIADPPSETVPKGAREIIFDQIYELDTNWNEAKKLQMAKIFVKENLMELREDEAGEYILEIISHLEFNRSYGANLKEFYKIEKQAPMSENKLEPDEIGITNEMRSKALNQALEIMRSGDPIKFIMDVVKKYHIGDEKTVEGVCVSVANQSCENSSGIQVAVNGGTGSGKSHGLKTVLRLVPSQYKVISALSPKAAYYMKLNPGIIVFSDDVSMSVEMEEIIKRATTNYQEETKYNTVYNGESKPLVIPPRINWYLTSVESEVSKEVLNRQLTFSTVENKDHKDTIFAKQ
jgi:primase-polymerase (primpol)-like protein